MIKYVIFDLDDTILDFHKGEIEGVSKILKQQGAPDVQKALQAYLELNKKIWENIETGASPQPLLNTRFSKTLALFGIDADGVKLEAQYREMLNHNFYTVPNVEELLTSLKNAGVNLFVGTNGVKVTQMERLKGSGLDKYFDDYFISEDIGFSKPSAEFFKPVFLRHPDLNKDNALMIGDRLQSDILGATRAGLNSIWFNPQKQINNSEIQPTFVANNYQQVQEIVMDEK